jgi:hypothetical protein
MVVSQKRDVDRSIWNSRQWVRRRAGGDGAHDGGNSRRLKCIAFKQEEVMEQG